MDSQIENAIEIVWNPTGGDPNLKSQAFEFLDRIRSDPQAWQVCTTLFTKNPRPSEIVRHVCLEIINSGVHAGVLGGQEMMYLRDALMAYVRDTYATSNPEHVDSANMQNKLTQTLTYLFVALYTQGWETFFDDFIALTGQNWDSVQGVTLYLRILGNVHDEIADVMVMRQGNEIKSHTDLKDLVRARHVHAIAQSWQGILARWANQNDSIAEMTLKVIGKWVSWIDISLIIGDGMLNHIFPLIGRSSPSGGEDKVRDSAVDAFTEIVGKKMRPADKTEMISFLNLREIITQLIASPPTERVQGDPTL
ncbi:hypothetical protein PG989_001848 [Apiospora arundinis]